MSEYFKSLFSLLKANNFKEPTTKEYLTYEEASKKHGLNARAPYFEDIHYVWRYLLSDELKQQ